MIRSLGIALICALCVGRSLAQTNGDILISSEYQTLRALFEQLKNRHALTLSYSPDGVDPEQVISIRPGSYSLNELLLHMGEEASLDIRLNANRLMIRRKSVAPAIPFEITGRLLADDRTPIPYAHVYLDNSQIGTFTNETGDFMLSGLLDTGNSELVVSAIGYTSFRRSISTSEARQELEITLTPSFTELNPIEVTTGSYQLIEGETTTMAISKKQIENAPNLIKDVFRTINMIPAVSNTDFSVKPRIRGGNFHETGIYLDGFELINPFHIEIGGGVQGLFNTEYIESIKVYPGSFSARYTDKLSGIVDLSTPSFFERNETNFSLDLLNAIASTKLKLGKNLYLLGAVRRGYWDFLIDLEARGTSLVFYDTWNKLVFRPANKHLLEFNLLYGKDTFDYSHTRRNIRIYYYNSDHDKLYGWVNWKATLSPKLFKRTTIGYQRLLKDSDFSFESTVSTNNIDRSEFGMVSLNEYFEYELNKNQHLSFGLEYRQFSNVSMFSERRYDIHTSTPSNPVFDTIDVDANISETLFGAYAEYTHRFNQQSLAKASVRTSGQRFNGSINIAPRINFRHQISSVITASVGYGWFYQPDQFYDLRSELGQSTLSNGSKALHYNANVTFEWPNTQLRFDIYHKVYPRLSDDFRLTPTERIETFQSFERSHHTTSGNATGFEVVLNHRYAGHTLNVSYAFAKNRIKNDLGQVTARALEIPHNFSINNLFQFPRDFNISTNLIFRSGFPYSEVLSTNVISFQEDSKQVITYQVGDKNNQRHSAYTTFDARVSKEWHGRHIQLEAYLNFLNLFNATNVRNIYYDAYRRSNGTLGANADENIFFPFFVTPGIKATF